MSGDACVLLWSVGFEEKRKGGSEGSEIEEGRIYTRSKSSNSDMNAKLKRVISRPPSCSPRRQYRKLTFINRSITSTTSFLHSSSVRDFLPAVFLNMGFAGFIALND